MVMKSHSKLLLGLSILLLAVGCVTSLTILVKVFAARVNMAFASTELTEDMSIANTHNLALTNPAVLALDCPGSVLGPRETFAVTATVHNPTNEPLNYVVEIVNGLPFVAVTSDLMIGSDPLNSTLLIHTGQNAQFRWTVTTSKPGSQYLYVAARSLEDIQKSDPGWANWKNSHYAICSFMVVDIFGLTGKEIILLILICTIAGALIWLDWFLHFSQWSAKRAKAG